MRIQFRRTNFSNACLPISSTLPIQTSNGHRKFLAGATIRPADLDLLNYHANAFIRDYSRDCSTYDNAQSCPLAVSRGFATSPGPYVDFSNLFSVPKPFQPITTPANHESDQQIDIYPSPVSDVFHHEDGNETFRDWQSRTSQHTPYGNAARSVQYHPFTDLETRSRRQGSCRRIEESLSSSAANEFSSARRRITKRKKIDLKPITTAGITKRAKGPRTSCDFPGCTVSVARAVDIQRHMKVKHGGDKHKFTCLLCKNGQSQGKSKEGWVFGLKYNLME